MLIKCPNFSSTIIAPRHMRWGYTCHSVCMSVTCLICKLKTRYYWASRVDLNKARKCVEFLENALLKSYGDIQ